MLRYGEDLGQRLYLWSEGRWTDRALEVEGLVGSGNGALLRGHCTDDSLMLELQLEPLRFWS